MIDALRFSIRYAFATFDANNDGFVDFDEFLLAIAATSQGDLDDRLTVAFEMSVARFRLSSLALLVLR